MRPLLGRLLARWRSVMPELLWRGYSPQRLSRLPLAVLEGATGKVRAERIRQLERGGTEVAPWLILTFSCFISGAFLAFWLFVIFVTSGAVGVVDWDVLIDRFFEGALPGWGYSIFWLVLVALELLLRPFQVGAGFSLYLDRRVWLEGWDLELAFRREIAERTANPGVGAAGRAAAALLLLALWLPGPPVVAQEEAGAAPEAAVAAPWAGEPEEDPRQLMAEIAERPELRRYEMEKRWQLKKKPDLDGVDDPDFSGLYFLGEVLRWISEGMEYILWGLLAFLVLYFLRERWRDFLPTRMSAPEDLRVPTLMGLDLRPESLPDDVPGTARELWAAGNRAEALGLLYRGALARLVEEGLEVAEGFTEEDCLRSARHGLEEEERIDFLARLTACWQAAAYAHRAPPTRRVEPLWLHWERHFGGAP
jgi:hypothetical protein